jgi:hypothetical protein
MSTYSDASLILPVAPEYKAGKIYSLKPTDGTGDFTVSRASKKHKINSDLKLEIINNDIPAFNYDAIGGCPVLNTEPQATNLITYPISFGNSYWIKSDATIEGDPSTAGSELITDGSFASAMGVNWTQTGTSWAIAGSGTAIYDAVLSGQGITQALTITDNSFYKITFTISSGTARISFAGYTGGALFEGESYTEYATGTHTIYRMALATNALSVFASNAGIGTAFTMTSVSVKEVQGYSAPSVDFPTSAFKLVESATNAVHTINTTTPAVGSDYSLSIFAKAGERRYISLALSDSVNWLSQYTFDLTDGVLTDTYNYSGVTSTFKSEALADGWYKLSLSSNYTFDTTVYSRIFIEETATPPTIPANSYLGDGTSGVYLFMAQVEAGSVATSPTFTDTTLAAEGSTTTRLADVVGGAGDFNTFNDVASSGVFFIESRALANDLSQRFISISDGTTNNLISIIYNNGSNEIRFLLIAGGVVQAELVTPSYTTTDFNKIAVRWALNDFSLWINGVEVLTNNSGSTFPTTVLNTLDLSLPTGSAIFYSETKQIRVLLYQTDAEMTTLTTL